MSNRNRQKILPVFGDTSSDFDIVLPKQTNALELLPIRLKIKDKVLNLTQTNEYAISIFKSIVKALSSEWHLSLSSNAALSYENQLFQFIPWLNNQNINLTNRYSILKDYETFRVNVNGVKPQSTGLASILKLLDQGIHSDNIDLKDLQYISLLIKNTIVSRNEERESATLCNFFASMPWLRKVLGENNYLSLESPKRLIV